MDTNHLFSGGLQLDNDEQFQPENSLRYATNFILTPSGHLLQERGSRIIGGPGLPIVGIVALNEQEILFSTDGTLSAIGYLTGDVYTEVIRSTFSLHYPVRGTAKVDYRGHRLVYWGDDYSWRWLDLDAPTTNLPTGLDVLAAPTSPVVSLGSVGIGGSLPTGIYQAAATLLTASKNETGYGLFTGTIPIVNEDPVTAPRQSLDGAPPQSEAAGSITFHLDNLDPTYSYVQLVIATYTGIANTLELFTLPLIAINGRTSLDYTYYSFSQHQEQTTLGDILNQVPDYVSAKEVTQKDGHLLAAGVKTALEDNIDWQTIANNVVLGPAIKEVPFSEAVNVTHYVGGTSTTSIDNAPFSYSKEDYKNPLLTTTGKSLQRNEVYSFCLIPIVKGRRLDAYHIPGAVGNSSAFAPYYSLEEYQAGNGYPTGAIRHHQMPDLVAQPLLGSGTIRILGVQEVVRPDFSSLAATQQASITGYIIGIQSRDEANRSILAQGILNPLNLDNGSYALYVSAFSGKPGFKVNASGNATFGTLSKEYAAFYSPETDILKNSVATATQLNQVATMSGTSYGVADKRTGGLGEEFAAVFLDYTSVASSFPIITPLLPPVTSTVPPQTGENPFITGERYPISTTEQNGFTLLKANLDSSTGFSYQGTAADIKYQYVDNATSLLLFKQSGGGYPSGDDANWKGVTSRSLYNLVANRPRQYGMLEQATYHPVFSSTPTAPAASFFQGDTFIGKVALISGTQEYQDQEPGLRYTTLNYFFCESTINVNYRHYLPSVGDLQGTLPYYPKSRTLWSVDGSGVMQYPKGLGQASGYNKQYSFTNKLTPFFPKDSTIDTVTDFSNRILYSVQALEGEQLDAYRVFKANDYHDIPKDKGPITSLFVLGSTLYTHTTGATYKNYFNETTTQTTSEGEVALGNGGLFNRPSTPITTVDGGYAGSQHPLAAVTTPKGHFFPDVTRKKVFRLSDSLEEITQGLQESLRTDLPLSSWYTASYDYHYERYILSGSTDFLARSFSTYTNKWSSFHSYFPSFTFSTPLRRLHTTSTTIGVADEGTVLDSSLSLTTNTSPDDSKWFSLSRLHTSQSPVSASFNTAEQSSGVQTVAPYTTYGQDPNPGQILYRTANDQYQFTLPRDLIGGRFYGKWLRSTWNFAATLFPTLVRLVGITFTPRSR